MARRQRMTPGLLSTMLLFGMGAIAIIISILKSILNYFEQNPDSGLILLTVIAICFIAYLLLKQVRENAQIREIEEAEEAKRLEELRRAEEKNEKIKNTYLSSIFFDYENKEYLVHLSEFPWSKMREIINNAYSESGSGMNIAEFTFKKMNKLKDEISEFVFTPLYHYYEFEKNKFSNNNLVKTIQEIMREKKIDESDFESVSSFFADNIFAIANYSYVLKRYNNIENTITNKYHLLADDDFEIIELNLSNLYDLITTDAIWLYKKIDSTIKKIPEYRFASKMLPEIKKMIDNKDMIGAKALYLQVFSKIDRDNIQRFSRYSSSDKKTVLGISYRELLQ